MCKKGLALDTPIPTPSGWSTMGELNVGDTVYDMNGEQTKVIAVSEVKNLPCFKMIFANGDSIICDDEHRWVATIGKSGNQKRKFIRPVYTVNELYNAKQEGKIVSVPVTNSINCDEKLISL